MDSVTVVFKNGNIVNFRAQDFNVDLTSDRGGLNKYAYKNAIGEESSIYLEPNEVVGIFLTQAAAAGGGAVSYRVPGTQASTQ